MSAHQLEILHDVQSTTRVINPSVPLSAKTQWALAYAAAGYKVMPTCTPSLVGACDTHGPGCRRPGKVPRVMWRPFQKALVTEELVRRWWGLWPDANLAVICGQPIRDGLYLAVLDVERSGLGVLTSVEVPATVTLHSQGGGLHFWFSTPWPLKSRAVRVSGTPLGDFRASGALATVPPSQGLLGPYSWAQGRGPGDIYIAPAPDWLLAGSQVQQAPEPVKKDKSNGRYLRPTQSPAALELLSDSLRDMFKFDYSLVDRSSLDFRVAIALFQQGVDEVCVQQVLLWPEKSKAREKLRIHGVHACSDYLRRTLRNAARRAAS